MYTVNHPVIFPAKHMSFIELRDSASYLVSIGKPQYDSH